MIKTELEEAAANLADPNICKTDNWIAGAKWQAEKMYSEEEVLNILVTLFAEAEDAVTYFEQFKKK
jgi:hypothetical protein